MKYIKKVAVSPIPEINGSVVDTFNVEDKTTNAPSVRLVEGKLTTVSLTEPTTGEKVWFKKSKNLFDKYIMDDFKYQEKYIYLHLKPNTQYTMSSNIGLTVNNATYIFFLLPNESISSSKNGVSLNVSRTLTTGDDGIAKISYRNVADTELVNPINSYWYQIEQGAVATEHEPYVEPEIFIKNENGIYESFVTKYTISSAT